MSEMGEMITGISVYWLLEEGASKIAKPVSDYHQE
jgi:hypothetical protein